MLPHATRSYKQLVPRAFSSPGTACGLRPAQGIFARDDDA
jgi:hypothetical protein